MKSDNTIAVSVCGETFQLASSNDEEYVKSLAEYVDSRLNEISLARGGNYISQSLKTALLALNLADDIFKERNKNSNYSQTMLQFPELENETLASAKKQLASLEEKLAAEATQKLELERDIDKLKERNRKLKNDLTVANSMYNEKKKELEDYINEFEKK